MQFMHIVRYLMKEDGFIALEVNPSMKREPIAKK